MTKDTRKEHKFHPYKTGFISSLPIWFKIGFLRWWAVGIAYMFLGFGSILRPGSYAQMLSIGGGIGLLTTFILNRVIRDLTRLPDEENFYLSVKRKGPMGTLTNVALSIVIVILIGFTYDGINRLFIYILSLDEKTIFLAAEPIGFACFYLFFDFLWRKLTFRKKKQNNMDKSDSNPL